MAKTIQTRKLLLALAFGIPSNVVLADCVVREFFVNPDRLKPVQSVPLPTSEKEGQATVLYPNMQVASELTVTIPQAGGKTTLKMPEQARSTGTQSASGAQSYSQRPYARLQEAIRNRNLEEFRKALPTDATEREALIQRRTDFDPMYWAIAYGAPLIVRELLALGLKVSGPDNWSRTRVWYAVKYADGNKLEIVKLLVAAGAPIEANINASGPIDSMLYVVKESPESLGLLRYLMERGVTIGSDLNHRGALLNAVSTGQTATVSLMLELGKPDQAAKNAALASAMSMSLEGKLTSQDREATIQRLLDAGADPRDDAVVYRDQYRTTPRVFDAVVQKDPALLSLLLKLGVNPNLPGYGGNSALMWATREFDLDAMIALLEAGADPNQQIPKNETSAPVGVTALHIAARAPTDDERRSGASVPVDPEKRRRAVDLLLMHGANPNLQKEDGFTPLMLTGRDDTEIIDALLQRGGTVNASGAPVSYYKQYKANVGPVTWALLNGKEYLATALIHKQKTLNTEDCGIVFYSAAMGSAKTLSAALDAGAEPDAARSERGLTPLIEAAYRGNTEAMRVLLDRKIAKPNESTAMGIGWIGGGHGLPAPGFFGGVTALMAAASSGRASAVRLLLDRGASVNAKDANGATALGHVQGKDAEAIRKMLVSAGAKG